jgi:UrcA family protein
MYADNRQGIAKGSIGVTAALAAGLIGLLPLTALATQGTRSQLEEPAVVVNYADLDIKTPLGAEKLYARIEHAATQLCPQAPFEELQRHQFSLRCRNDVVAHAVSSINSPQLAAVYVSRTHRGTHSPV